ncbi:baseplate assembly protein [Salmonella enterica]|uniref:Baseplate assembly protein n=1 Tax=Salmonella enterica TaxID=28901 RepID=A0A760WN73_SALER|nr:baseplate assembly protein [Salmonella enterica subsp. enterica serovar Schwarzengrund]EBN5051596.1 baseplate assembly protein [Salmonella enterica]EDP9253417.1 baseplate assembly protein [Salmonella enterica subsp. enterica serovar Newmexico]EDW4992497.1 baseplate assembly protein [Salmonella enterica subsp. enterica serovar Sandiego]HAU6860913.1 baseplate assembly protein [Salmonella enterica subsp. enterica serovar Senftenberg]
MNGVNNRTGKRLSGVAHLRQSVSDILTTPIGSRVLVRDYGSYLFSLVDNPRDDLTRLQIIAASATALARWETRLKVTRVLVSFPEGESGCVLDIEGINKETNLPVRTGDITIYGKQL